ncbi:MULTISPECIES: hypothetical protein [Rhizobium/Agrobacterium group]|uniref:RNase H type-1 domain-containing protein n=1 Tax=Rhizobium rhizogenes TaxID=359 RepID=A0A546XI42_RHIRH|nr:MULTISPECIES: hypothetical protein [Rhizobium/Agrobacterium group]TRB00382.1 hypothetical protein EXN68_11715 [Rhizobium rhizogenes]
MSNEYKLFFSVAGTPGKTGFPQHVWAAYLEDPDGKQVWSNTVHKPSLLDGDQSSALYAAIGAALESIPSGYTLLLFAPQDEIRWVYSVSREQRRANRYRASNRRERPNAHLIRPLDDLAEQLGVTLTARQPVLDHEFDMLEVARRDASARWTDACQALGNKF